MSEIKRRADEIRGLAQKCECLHDLMVALNKASDAPWPMESVLMANEELGLDLPSQRPKRKGKVRAGVAVPKPEKKK
jgi:hypothetical protein